MSRGAVIISVEDAEQPAKLQKPPAGQVAGGCASWRGKHRILIVGIQCALKIGAFTLCDHTTIKQTKKGSRRVSSSPPQAAATVLSHVTTLDLGLHRAKSLRGEKP